MADGDHIYGVIKGTTENHGGRANSLTAPNAKAQTELLIDAYERAQIDPSTVSYIEAHGTGTSLGDPVEINGLKKAFKELYRREGKEYPFRRAVIHTRANRQEDRGVFQVTPGYRMGYSERTGFYTTITAGVCTRNRASQERHDMV